MAKTVDVLLSDPIRGHGGEITKVVLREPRALDFFELGEPIAFAVSKDGMQYTADNEGTIKLYIDRCLVEPKDPLLLEQLSLADAMKLKETVVNFFLAARRSLLPAPAIPSSSGSDASTPKSAAA